MITDDERFIKIQVILALSDIHPNDCIKINDLIIDLSKQNQQLQNQVEKLIQENNDLEQLLSKQYCDGLRQGKFDNEMKVLELQSVIDKAVEYLDNWKDNWYANSMQNDRDNLFELLEILRSKE